MKQLFPLFCLLFAFNAQAQNYTFETFKDTRVINTHSVETIGKRKLDVRIGHRFGDLIGDNGGWETFYGLENSTDILTGVDYGLTDNVNLGLYRTKGAGNLKQLINLTGKYRIIRQSDNGSPITLTVLGVGTISTMKKNPASTGINSFPKFTHRMAYASQIIIARKFSDKFSLQLIPSYVHRNLVPFDDTNDIFSLGFATRVQMTRVIGLVVDATIPLNGYQSPFTEDSPDGQMYYPAIGLGLEFDTGGHVFQLNFTNATGIMETDYISNTTSNWLDGEFRIGFTISRLFNL